MKTVETNTAPLVVLPSGQLGSTAILPSFPNYVFHTSGEIWSIKQKRFLKGYVNSQGYRRVTLIGADGQRKVSRVSRLIAECFLGPANGRIVDHRNRVKTSDSIQNLRYLTHLENNFNRTNTKGSSSAYLGVSFRKDVNKWLAAITVRGQRHYLGFYKEELAASQAYQTAKQRLHTIAEPTIGLNPEDVAKALILLANRQTCSTHSEPQNVRL